MISLWVVPSYRADRYPSVPFSKKKSFNYSLNDKLLTALLTNLSFCRINRQSGKWVIDFSAIVRVRARYLYYLDARKFRFIQGCCIQANLEWLFNRNQTRWAGGCWHWSDTYLLKGTSLQHCYDSTIIEICDFQDKLLKKYCCWL